VGEESTCSSSIRGTRCGEGTNGVLAREMETCCGTEGTVDDARAGVFSSGEEIKPISVTPSGRCVGGEWGETVACIEAPSGGETEPTGVTPNGLCGGGEWVEIGAVSEVSRGDDNESIGESSGGRCSGSEKDEIIAFGETSTDSAGRTGTLSSSDEGDNSGEYGMATLTVDAGAKVDIKSESPSTIDSDSNDDWLGKPLDAGTSGKSNVEGDDAWFTGTGRKSKPVIEKEGAGVISRSSSAGRCVGKGVTGREGEIEVD
jgi:hypothetical protein